MYPILMRLADSPRPQSRTPSDARTARYRRLLPGPDSLVTTPEPDRRAHAAHRRRTTDHRRSRYRRRDSDHVCLGGAVLRPPLPRRERLAELPHGGGGALSPGAPSPLGCCGWPGAVELRWTPSPTPRPDSSPRPWQPSRRYVVRGGRAAGTDVERLGPPHWLLARHRKRYRAVALLAHQRRGDRCNAFIVPAQLLTFVIAPVIVVGVAVARRRGLVHRRWLRLRRRRAHRWTGC
jgi:hypothetical protein